MAFSSTVISELTGQTTSNYTTKTLESWNHIERFMNYAMWALNGLCVLLFITAILGFLLPSFRIRKRVVGVKLLVYIMAINRPLTRFALPAPLILKVRAQILAEALKKSSSDPTPVLGATSKLRGPQPFPTTTMKSIKVSSTKDKRSSAGLKMPLARITTTSDGKISHSPTPSSSHKKESSSPPSSPLPSPSPSPSPSQT